MNLNEIRLIAKKFISVYDLLALGIEIKNGTKLYDPNGTHVGDYVEHIKDGQVDYHTKTSVYNSLAFPIHMYGIIVELPFGITEINTHLSNNDVPECEHEAIEGPMGTYICSKCNNLL